MPNWVFNELTCIFKTSEELNLFKEKANVEGLFHSFFPMPSVLENTRSPHLDPNQYLDSLNKKYKTNHTSLEAIAQIADKWDAENATQLVQNLKAFHETGYYEWHSWCFKNWGVKWDATHCKSNTLSDFNTIVFNFDTAWDSPNFFVVELSKLYPNANFEMVSGSPENNTHSEFTCANGELEYGISYDSFKEAVEDGKWGGTSEWEYLFDEEEEEEEV